MSDEAASELEKAEPPEAKPDEPDRSESERSETEADEAKANAAESEAAKSEAPAKKRKKKRKADDDATDRTSDRPENWPVFALAFPRDAALDNLVWAFERGNYAKVREGAKRLLDERPARPDDVRSAARELLRRLDPDPIAVYLLAGACLLLAFLAIWYWTHTGSVQ